MMNDEGWKRMRGFIAWGILGLIILVGVSIVASLVFFGSRSYGTFHPFFPGYLFPFHFGWLGGIFLLFVVFFVARWVLWPRREGNSLRSYSQYYDDDAQKILRERYAKGEITKEQFEQMMLDLKQHD